MRRVVTGIDENGKSTVVYDGPPQSAFRIFDARVGAMVVEPLARFLSGPPPGESYCFDIWDTVGLPRKDSPDLAAKPRKFSIELEGKGLRIRYAEWGANADSSTIHSTDTLDVNVVLSGQVELLLDEGRSVLLRKGDAVVLPGVRHGWRAGPEGASILFIMQHMG
jgi:uncharacterized cupin superfamily protein